jgi:hypothetical protein
VAIENPKRYKSPGVDQIPAELIKIICIRNMTYFVRMWSGGLNR